MTRLFFLYSRMSVLQMLLLRCLIVLFWNKPYKRDLIRWGTQLHDRLVFDIVDTENQRSIAGCTYHVSHPGGRSYETFPVNANEAEARRSARFWEHGITQGRMKIPAEETHPEQPLCLDLRNPKV